MYVKKFYYKTDLLVFEVYMLLDVELKSRAINLQALKMRFRVTRKYEL
jgi:hypothetical protein